MNMSVRLKRRIAGIPVFLLLLVVALIVLLPVVWMMISSFKPAKEIISYPRPSFSSRFPWKTTCA